MFTFCTFLKICFCQDGSFLHSAQYGAILSRKLDLLPSKNHTFCADGVQTADANPMVDAGASHRLQTGLTMTVDTLREVRGQRSASQTCVRVCVWAKKQGFCDKLEPTRSSGRAVRAPAGMVGATGQGRGVMSHGHVASTAHFHPQIKILFQFCSLSARF